MTVGTQKDYAWLALCGRRLDAQYDGGALQTAGELTPAMLVAIIEGLGARTEIEAHFDGALPGDSEDVPSAAELVEELFDWFNDRGVSVASRPDRGASEHLGKATAMSDSFQQCVDTRWVIDPDVRTTTLEDPDYVMVDQHVAVWWTTDGLAVKVAPELRELGSGVSTAYPAVIVPRDTPLPECFPEALRLVRQLWEAMSSVPREPTARWTPQQFTL